MNTSYLSEQTAAEPTTLGFQALKMLWQIATRAGLTEEERIHAMLRQGAESLGMEIAVVGRLSDVWTVAHAHDPTGQLTDGTVTLLCNTLCANAFATDRPLYIPDLGGHPVYQKHPLVVRTGLGAYAAIPVHLGERTWGVLALMRHAPLLSGFDESHTTFMEMIAAWVGQFLFNRQQRTALEQLALTDELTGLLNRRAAEARLREEAARARRHDEGFILVLVDLDHFKLINDRYGHNVGDEMLAGFSRLLMTLVREEDWVARWGGEEFIVFLRTEVMDRAVAILERLREDIKAHPFTTTAGALHVTISAGLGQFNPEGKDHGATLARADSALYEAKTGGRDRVVAGARSSGVLHKASLLKHAARENRIRAAYQIIVDLKDFRPVGDETLARLKTPDGEILPAGEFVGAAEGLHLMPEIDATVANLAMERCSRHIAGAHARPDFLHFVNLSPQFLARRDLVDSLLASAAAYCARCGVEMDPIKPVVFEITERQAIGNLDTLEQDLRPLLDFGFRLALDDFGSGYSSFLYLCHLPIRFLKIEGWMVQNMHTSRKVSDLMQSIVLLARNQGITTIAERVEDEATALRLRDLGVDWAQGYYFGRPELDQESGNPVAIG
jgi:diguanylate cyclase (GGDEF)-like protein